jgi:hypothetical protein
MWSLIMLYFGLPMWSIWQWPFGNFTVSLQTSLFGYCYLSPVSLCTKLITFSDFHFQSLNKLQIFRNITSLINSGFGQKTSFRFVKWRSLCSNLLLRWKGGNIQLVIWKTSSALLRLNMKRRSHLRDDTSFNIWLYFSLFLFLLL